MDINTLSKFIIDAGVAIGVYIIIDTLIYLFFSYRSLDV